MGISFWWILLLFAGIIYFLYAKVISNRNKMLEALSGIDVQMKKRFDLIPNILKIAQKFLEHEKNLITEITQLRTKVQSDYNKKDKNAVAEHLSVAEGLQSKMGQLMISAENYPNLKSNETMVQAMRTYNEVEAEIAAARRFYNAAVTQLNNSVQIFPSSFIASIIGIEDMPFLKTDEKEKAPIDVDKFLK